MKSITLPSADQNKAQANYFYNQADGTAYVNDILENKVTQKTPKYLKQYDNPTTYSVLQP